MAAILRIAACFFVLAVLLPEATLGLKCYRSSSNGRHGKAMLTKSTTAVNDECGGSTDKCPNNPIYTNADTLKEYVCVCTVLETGNYWADCAEKGHCERTYYIMPKEGANSKYRSGAWLCNECNTDYCNYGCGGAGHLSLQLLAPVGSLILVLMAKKFI